MSSQMVTLPGKHLGEDVLWGSEDPPTTNHMSNYNKAAFFQEVSILRIVTCEHMATGIEEETSLLCQVLNTTC